MNFDSHHFDKIHTLQFLVKYEFIQYYYSNVFDVQIKTLVMQSSDGFDRCILLL